MQRFRGGMFLVGVGLSLVGVLWITSPGHHAPRVQEEASVRVPRPMVSCLVEKFKNQPANLGYQLFLWSSELLAGRGFVVDCGAQRWEVRVGE